MSQQAKRFNTLDKPCEGIDCSSSWRVQQLIDKNEAYLKTFASSASRGGQVVGVTAQH